jgi:hypothetical protein
MDGDEMTRVMRAMVKEKRCFPPEIPWSTTIAPEHRDETDDR